MYTHTLTHGTQMVICGVTKQRTKTMIHPTDRRIQRPSGPSGPINQSGDISTNSHYIHAYSTHVFYNISQLYRVYRGYGQSIAIIIEFPENNNNNDNGQNAADISSFRLTCIFFFFFSFNFIRIAIQY